MSEREIKVMLVDDHAMVRNGVRMMLALADEIRVVAEAENGHVALQLAQEHELNVALVDISLPGIGGLDLLKQLKLCRPKMAVLILSMYSEEMYAVRAMKLGAAGYLTKNAPAESLIEAVRKAASGRKYISPAFVAQLAEMVGGAGMTAHESLSNREMEVMRLISGGSTLVAIGEALHLSPSTVTTYRARILEKLGLKSNAELTRYTTLHGLAI